jgi:hypothetical protein
MVAAPSLVRPTRSSTDRPNSPSFSCNIIKNF